jgi:hypothetical protein
MNIVIQCAGSKHPGGSLKTRNGQKVCFVANPELASRIPGCIFARPDDQSGEGGTWRQRLEDHVSKQAGNPLGLLKAYQLYKPKPYALLVERFTEKKVFILSAGWGMIRADYPTPDYDITFNSGAKKKNPSAYCTSRVGYKYFQQIPEGDNEPIVFLGGKGYLPLFQSLVAPLNRRTVVFVRAGVSAEPTRGTFPRNWEVRHFRTPLLTNWHYECAEALGYGALSLD